MDYRNSTHQRLTRCARPQEAAAGDDGLICGIRSPSCASGARAGKDCKNFTGIRANGT